MSGGRPLIVVSLPARSADEALEQIGAAKAAGADVAELRLDRFSPEARGDLRRLFPSELPLLATLRSRTEGGEGPDDPGERSEWLLAFARQPFAWIDVEFDRDLPAVVRLPPAAQLGRIVSSHLPAAGTGAWDRRLAELEECEGIGKLVLPGSVPFALGDLRHRLADRRSGSVVVHTVGGSGPLLRALAGTLHFPLVYAALPERDAPAPVEASQIPVDRLRPFLEAGGRAPIFAVVGRPIAHSASPRLHHRWMRELDRPGLYVALELSGPAEFVESLPLLADAGVRGLNVTHPLKTAAYGAATLRGASATACEAANCLSLRGSDVDAENTDLAALLRRLRELRAEGRWDGEAITIVGSGGAARATVAAAEALGARATVLARRPEAARALGAPTGGTPKPARLLVHATTAGREGSGPLEVPLAPWLGPGSHVLDWVYAPADPTVRRSAESAGASYEDGWRLLVYQAAASFAIWWGEEPAAHSVAAVAEEGPCAA